MLKAFMCSISISWKWVKFTRSLCPYIPIFDKIFAKISCSFSCFLTEIVFKRIVIGIRLKKRNISFKNWTHSNARWMRSLLCIDSIFMESSDRKRFLLENGWRCQFNDQSIHFLNIFSEVSSIPNTYLIN